MAGWIEGVTGNEKDTFSTGYEAIPDGTRLKCFIDEVKIDNNEYKLTWKVEEDCEYKGRIIWQSLNVLHESKFVAKKSQNMLMLLMKMFSIPVFDQLPALEELTRMQGRIAEVIIGLYVRPDKNNPSKTIERNVINEVWPTGAPHPVEDFGRPQSALDRNPRVTAQESDVPF